MADYYQGDVQKQFEAAIPVLIILLLVVGVIAINPGLVSGIPVLGDIFGGPAVDVLILGDSITEANDWKAHLSGDIASKVFNNPINVEVMTDNQYNLISSADWINSRGYDLIIITAKDLTPGLQITLKNWVQGGGKLFIIGTGGINTNGRWAELQEVIPVTCGTTEDCTAITEQVYAPRLVIKAGKFDNPLAKKLDTATPMTAADASINLANVVSPNDIVYIDGFDSAENVQAGATGNYYPGIAESTGVTGGKVLWISFNPTTENITPQVKQSLVINTLAYILGVEGFRA